MCRRRDQSRNPKQAEEDKRNPQKNWMAGGRDKQKTVPRDEGYFQKAKDPAKEDPADVGEKRP